MLAWLQSVDGSIPPHALLVAEERLLATQNGVGLYDNGQKSPNHQQGTVHVTSHRLLYIDDARPELCSLALQLSTVAQSEYYNGFLTSSSKVELVLNSASTDDDDDDEGWTCAICAHENPRSLGQRRTHCALCGAVRPAKSTSAPAPANELQCTVCTFINVQGATSCEICGTPLPLPKPKSIPTQTNERQTMKISFRKGGDKAFYAVLKKALQAKAWKVTQTADLPRAEQGAGISGILNAVESNTSASTDSVASALKDLEALTAQAKSMVALASTLSAKLQQQSAQSSLSSSPSSRSSTPLSSSTPTPDATSFIQRSLYNMGLTLSEGPVVQSSDSNSSGDERRYLDELAAEVGGLLSDGLMGGRGMVGLDEIWCAWNRARGVALLAPETFIAALQKAITGRGLGLGMRTLKSGLIVLHEPRLSHASFCARLLSSTPPPFSGTVEDTQVWHTPLDVAAREDVAVALAAQLLQAAEDDGLLWRDVEPFGGVRWTRNVLKDWTWDGD
ncbi:hypothetical protein EXIGLDRAFT_836834 [Exidia glandulosa HHB12029]|uniref:Vacuolar protein-sorting-associated protein 36 n=1 Tax=Exidia glandulosa HHB12029 TaxID=1314781 RepID=A0A165HES9_EXIGL|nr:hypothetical protein EXIGLDRAFT_836834 [Exidia glandulosa HHB12029]